MHKEVPDDLGGILRDDSNSNSELADNKPRRIEINTGGIDDIADTSPKDTEKRTVRKIATSTYDYLTNRQRLKALAVLGGTIGGALVLGDKLNDAREYFNALLPSQPVLRELITLTIDTTTNAITAPLGFFLSNYAHGKKLSKKECVGQVAFALAWGLTRHYVYSGLNNLEVAPRIPLYIGYYFAYGGLYAIFSEYWRKVCEGIPHLEAIKGTSKKFKNKFKDILKDGQIQFNLALNILNIVLNPVDASKPTVAGFLLIDYDMSIVRHSHERMYGFWGYLRSVLASNKYDNKKTTPS